MCRINVDNHKLSSRKERVIAEVVLQTSGKLHGLAV